jgi:lactate permease
VTPWIQVYDPLGSPWLSTAAAALPIVLLLVALAVLEWRAHKAALAGLIAALAIATLVYGMPPTAAAATAIYGAAYGFLPIGWIVLNAVFLYELTVATGQFQILRRSVGQLSKDRRVQALLVAFSFGAFIEGACGFGAPIAICSALLIGLGFAPLYAAGLSLIANTAPVAFGSIGIPILTLASVTGIPAQTLGMMAGRQLPFVSVIIPIWLVATLSGWRGLRGVWPAVLVCGGTFGIVQFLWSNFIGVELVDIAGGVASIGALALLCRTWQPRDIWTFEGDAQPLAAASVPDGEFDRRLVRRAWMPWLFLSIAVIVWGMTPVKAALNSSPVLAPRWNVPYLHRLVFRDYPVVPVKIDPAQIADTGYRNAHAEPAVYTLNWVSATGTGVLLATLATALYFRVSLAQLLAVAATTMRRMRVPLATIMLMLSLGFVTRYGGTDATLGLAFTRTGVLYPFFAAFLGWLGVALTGSDTSSNVLFGSLQKITAEQLGFNPVLIVTANSTGGVMGKMIDAQSIVISTASTGQVGQEGRILRFVFWHSVALATIMAIIVMLQAYVVPWMIPVQP